MYENFIIVVSLSSLYFSRVLFLFPISIYSVNSNLITLFIVNALFYVREKSQKINHR
jgi:hypothetical protein